MRRTRFTQCEQERHRDERRDIGAAVTIVGRLFASQPAPTEISVLVESNLQAARAASWWAVVTFTACTAVIALCREYWQIALMRFVSGLGIAAVYSVGTLLAAEYVPTGIRSTVLGTLQAGWSLGNVLAALLAAAVIPRLGWRPLFVAGIVPGIVALVMLTVCRIRPASPRREFRARAMLDRRSARRSGAILPSAAPLSGGP